MRPLGGFFVAVVVAMLLRSTALSSLAARGIIIDVIALATVIWALRHGDAWGATLGFALGLMADLDAAHWLGRHALLLSLLGYAVGRLAHTLVRDSGRTQFALIGVGVLIHQLWSAAFELGGDTAGLPFLLVRALIATVLSGAAGVAFLWLLRGALGRSVFAHASRTSAAN
jgi:rod shape-determining protein MreD